ncbi:MAG: hypothetical protein IJK06_04150 [Clostridia bacterium]|nr:hypothetical protein [Clostridia bacterium]
MPNNVGKEWTFNTVADSYEKIRPGYPDELYQALFAYAAPDDSCSALEIGIGGGQATLPVLKTGSADGKKTVKNVQEGKHAGYSQG